MSFLLTVTGSGEGLAHCPGTVGFAVRDTGPAIDDRSLSSTNVVATCFGRTSPTLTVSDLFSVSTLKSETRACALMNGTCAARKNHGTSLSVSFTSAVLEVHAFGSEGTVVSTGLACL